MEVFGLGSVSLSLSMVTLICEACVESLTAASWWWWPIVNDKLVWCNTDGHSLIPRRHVYWKRSALGVVWGLGPYVVLMDIPNNVFLMCVEFIQKHFNSSQLLMIDWFLIITNKRILQCVSPIGVKKPLYIMCVSCLLNIHTTFAQFGAFHLPNLTILHSIHFNWNLRTLLQCTGISLMPPYTFDLYWLLQTH